MKHEGIKTEQKPNTLEIQAEPEVVAHGIADAFKKWRAEKAAEAQEETGRNRDNIGETTKPQSEANESAETTGEAEVDDEMPELETPEELETTNDASSEPNQDDDYIPKHSLEEILKRREESAKHFAEWIADLNQDFIKLKPSLKDFPKWEEDYSYYWRMLKAGIREAQAFRSEDEARIEEPVFFTTSTGLLHETIEAQAGNFFQERARKLRDAINASGKSEADKKRELSKIDALWEYAARHMEFKNMSREDVRGYGPAEYERSRTNTHNNAIEALNDLNDLARSYGLTPFTPRNFWTSRSSSKDDPAPIKKRMRYDRDLVEEYYAIAFRRELADEKKKAQDRQNGFYGGSDW